jgi:hypothetical protein
MKRLLLISGTLLLIVWACIETEQVSPIPEISFNSFEVSVLYDTSLNQYLPVGILDFDFIDGDADFGIYRDEVDTVAWNEDNYNVFLIPYQKIDTSYIAIELDQSKPPPYYTIWHNEKLDRLGQNKTVKGTITITIFPLPVYDTIRYDFYITDRARHRSNIESSSDVGAKPEIPDL